MKNEWQYLYDVSNHGWSSGLPETRCGGGSMIKNNIEVIESINRIIYKYLIRSIVDLGCGDFNWISQVDLDGVKYDGYDWIFKVDMGEKLSMNVNFHEMNIADLKIPKTDLIICKDVFIHMKNEHISLILDNIRQSKSKYLLTTTFDINNNDRQIANYAPLNIEIDPFNISNPLEVIHISENKFLNLYKL